MQQMPILSLFRAMSSLEAFIYQHSQRFRTTEILFLLFINVLIFNKKIVQKK